jgi:DNA-binding transcriptional MerR regulator
VPEPEELTIEVLAGRTGVPTRTIRFYRQSGLLPPPTRVGRRAVYADDQVERLRTISTLRAEGLSLEAIGRALATDQDAPELTLARLNRIGEEARSLWDRDRAAELTRQEILDRVGPKVSLAEGEALLADLEAHDLIRTTARTRPASGVDGLEVDEPVYAVPSLGTLDLAGRLFAAGVSAELAYASWTAMHQWLRPLAIDLVNLFARSARTGVAQGLDDDVISEAMRRLLPIALHGVQLAFGSEIEHALDELVSSDDTPAWLRTDDPR